MADAALLRALEEAAQCPVLENVPLSSYTSFHIGGPARFFAEAPTVSAIACLLKTARAHGLHTLVLGGGTNLLASDDGFDGLAIRLTLDRMTINERCVTVEAGVRTADLVACTVAWGLGGLQFAAGLPGTIGGGLAGNAGCFGCSLSDRLIRATVLSLNGDIIEVTDPGWFEFSYRHSRALSEGHLIAEAVLGLVQGEREVLEAESSRHLDLRREKHPAPSSHTAGSYFKNLPPLKTNERRRAAGWYLDQVGAREMRVGDAAVFERHANIIVNRGRATARDVLTLAAEMKRKVSERFQIDLIPEVRFIGRRPPGL